MNWRMQQWEMAADGLSKNRRSELGAEPWLVARAIEMRVLLACTIKRVLASNYSSRTTRKTSSVEVVPASTFNQPSCAIDGVRPRASFSRLASAAPS